MTPNSNLKFTHKLNRFLYRQQFESDATYEFVPHTVVE